MHVHKGGFPHSDIHGSKLIRSSPWLNAAYHVLHRLCVPRHPLNALITLDSHSIKFTSCEKVRANFLSLNAHAR